MKNIRKVITVLSFTLALSWVISVFASMQLTMTASAASVTTVPESDGNKVTESSSHTVFIMSYNMVYSRVAEFYKYLEDFKNISMVEYIYAHNVPDALTDKNVMAKIADSDKVIMVDLEPTNDDMDLLKSSCKAGVNFYYVACHRLSQWASYPEGLNVLSAHQVWIDMYYANIADAEMMNFTNSTSEPTSIAGLGLAIYLQYKINNNACAEVSYSDLASKIPAETLNSTTEECYTKTKKLLTEDPTFKQNESDPILHLTEVNGSDNINQYIQKYYHVYDAFYSNVTTIEQTADGNPVCYDTVYTGYKPNENNVYTWAGGKWKLQTTYPKIESALKALTWSNGKRNIKVYRYTDSTAKANPLKNQYNGHATNIQRDSAGNFYMSRYNDDDGKYYIYQLYKDLKIKYEVCVSDLLNSQYARFHVLADGKVLLETYDYADTSSVAVSETGWNEKLRLYNNLQLLDLASGKITKEYDIGYYPYGHVKVNGKFIYMQDTIKKNIVVIDSDSGKVVNVISLHDYDDLIKPHNYSEELGVAYDYNYDYDISGKYIYILKKTGVYRIDMSNGKFRNIIDDGYEPFGIQDMRFLDFKVKDSDTFYILAANFDSPGATHFYTYTK